MRGTVRQLSFALHIPSSTRRMFPSLLAGMASISGKRLPLVRRDDCDGEKLSEAACEKPVSELLKTVVPAVIMGVILLIAAIVLFVFVLRHRRIEKLQDLNDQRRSLDFTFEVERPTSHPISRNGNTGGPSDMENPFRDGESSLSQYGGAYRLADLGASKMETRNQSGDGRRKWMAG
ncbi:hypothetical protein DL98DRAFT_515392 [Cadophora sp. DSE1049]|nr:hypothetical protein DL98DRAFT_515392 [Cadophora sp. DSE1049]